MPIGRWKPALVAVLVAVALSSCDDDPQASASSFDRAAAQHDLAALYAGDHPSAAQLRDGDCLADRFLDTVSVEQLRRVGVVDERGGVASGLPVLDRRTAEAWADAQLACVDFVAASTRALGLVKHGGLDEDAYAGCLRAALSEDQQRAAVVASLMGDLEAAPVAVLARAQARCARQGG